MTMLSWTMKIQYLVPVRHDNKSTYIISKYSNYVVQIVQILSAYSILSVDIWLRSLNGSRFPLKSPRHQSAYGDIQWRRGRSSA